MGVADGVSALMLTKAMQLFKPAGRASILRVVKLFVWTAMVCSWAPLPEQSFFVTKEGDSFRFKRSSDGQCLGAKMCGGTVCTDGRLERNICSTENKLQLFYYNSSSKFLSSSAKGNPMCVTTCAGPHA